MTDAPPILFWFRRDLRLADHAGLTAVSAAGRPVIPVFVLDPDTESLGAAVRWRLERALAAFEAQLEALGSRLVLRRGPALETLRALAGETGARGVHWSRLYHPVTRPRDTEVKAGLRASGLEAESHAGHLLHEPWSVETKAGGFFKVYTPFWRAVSPRDIPEPLAPVARLAPPRSWPASDRLEDWSLAQDMDRGAAVVARFACVGEAAARDRLGRFVEARIADYATARDRPDIEGTSGLSENLTYGEISPRSIWHAGMRAREEGAGGAETFLKELVWREFAWHLLSHTPRLETGNWRQGWDGFPWRGDNPEAERWRRGMTGEPMIDAAMRELFVTGTMHNRMRMLVASYLTKHLLTHWRVGLDWFAETLIDWDPASNALGWQWVAGSGPDAAPYFRIFNPATQAEKFDPHARYRRRFLGSEAEGPAHGDARAFFAAVPRSWGLDAAQPYPEAIIDLKRGREAALAAYRTYADAETGART